MREYRIYRHPQQPVVAVPAHNWLNELLGREDRLIRAGYRYAGSVHAASAADATRDAGARVVGPTTSSADPQPGTRPDTQTPQPPPVALAAIAAAVVGSALLGLVLFAHEVLQPAPDTAAPVTRRPAVERAITEVIESERLAESGDSGAAAAAAGFSPWMSWPQTRAFAERIDQRRQRVAAVEARETGGEGQCRLRLEPAPPDVRHQWYWWCAQPEAEFARLKQRYAAEGYTQVQQHLFIGNDEQVRYSGVWHKEWRDGG
jgi:hypothetical protein